VDPAPVIAALEGVARWAELERHGVGRRGLARACAEGRVLRLGRGLYCLPGAQDRPVVRAVAVGAVLACGAAAEHHGLEVFGEPGLHVTRESARAVGRGIVVHRRATEHDARATGLRQTLLDCCRCLPSTQAVSVLDSALRQGRVELAELQGLAPGRGPWAGRVARAVSLVDPQAQSVLESAARVLLVEASVGAVSSQVHVPCVGWVDLVVDGWLVVETDGQAVHRDTFAEDRRRDAELVRQGFVVLRFTYHDVHRRPAWVVHVVREAVRHGAGHRRARDR
jgi:very-short-patch-repair endonuclease